MKRTAMAIVAGVALAAAPAVAQAQQGAPADSSRGMGLMQGRSGMMQMMHGGSGMMQGMMNAGMMGMAGGPGMVLRLKGVLDLTDSQVTQLEALRDSARSTMRQHMMQGMQLMRSASTLLAGDSPDLDAYQAQLLEASKHMVLAHTARARVLMAARQLLTPQQRERLSLAREVMQEMGSGTMGGGMMGGGMMGGGMMHGGTMRQGGRSPSGT